MLGGYRGAVNGAGAAATQTPPKGTQSRDPMAVVPLPSAKVAQVPPRPLSPVTWALTGRGAGGGHRGCRGQHPNPAGATTPRGTRSPSPLNPTCAGDMVAALGTTRHVGTPRTAAGGSARGLCGCTMSSPPPGQPGLPKVTGTPRRDVPAMAAPASHTGKDARDMGDSGCSQRSPFWCLPTHISSGTTPHPLCTPCHPIPRRVGGDGGAGGPASPPQPCLAGLPPPGTSRTCPCSKGD